VFVIAVYFVVMNDTSHFRKVIILTLEVSLQLIKQLSLLSLQDIFMFITRQLKGLEDTKSPQFNRYFYLLEVSFITYFIRAVKCSFSA